MKKNPPKKLPQYRKRKASDVGPEVLQRLKKTRLATTTPLQIAATEIEISMSTLWAMERGLCPMTEEQAQALFSFYARRTCAIASEVAAVLGS